MWTQGKDSSFPQLTAHLLNSFYMRAKPYQLLPQNTSSGRVGDDRTQKMTIGVGVGPEFKPCYHCLLCV